MLEDPEALEIIKEIRAASQNGLYHAFNNSDENDTKFSYLISEMTIIDMKVAELLALIEREKKK